MAPKKAGKTHFLLKCVDLRFNPSLPTFYADQDTRWSNCFEQYTEWGLDEKRKNVVFVGKFLVFFSFSDFFLTHFEMFPD